MTIPAAYLQTGKAASRLVCTRGTTAWRIG